MTTEHDITTTSEPDEAQVEAFAEHVFDRLLGAVDTYATHIGVKLGWYDSLAGVESMTATELAAATATDERYAREWLEHQTVAGYLSVIDASMDPTKRRFAISPAAAEVLTNRDSLSFMAPFPGFMTALGENIELTIQAYRDGSGVGWHQHGEGARLGQAEANRPVFLNLLGQQYLRSIPAVDAALTAGGSVADVGCGLGWSSIGVAKTYSDARVDGYDLDTPSIEEARNHAEEEGVADRVRFHTTDITTLADADYDLVLALECIHDMADPVSVLAAMKNIVADTGTVIVMDERVGETFTGEPDPVEHLMYGFSLLCCLADGRNAPESVATGTVMRPPTLERYATDAGFSAVSVLPIENDFFRFYQLHHNTTDPAI